MTAVETYEHAGVEVKLYQEEDMDFCDPRQMDNLGVMYVYRPGYELGDEQLDDSGLPYIECSNCEGSGEDPNAPEPTETILGHPIRKPDCPTCEGHGEREPTLNEWAREIGAIAIMPLFIYEHSGMTMRSGRFVWLASDDVDPDDTRSTGRFPMDGAGWDTSFSGFIIATRERWDEVIDSNSAPTPERVEEILESEVTEYARWMEGDCWYYVAGHNTPFMDSCGGIIGMDAAKEEANMAADLIAKQLANESNERVEMAARDISTAEVA